MLIDNLVVPKIRPYVNLGIGTTSLELELELILQTLLFPLPQGLWAPKLAGW